MCSLGNDCHSLLVLDLVVDVPESEMAMTRTSPSVLELSSWIDGLVPLLLRLRNLHLHLKPAKMEISNFT